MKAELQKTGNTMPKAFHVESKAHQVESKVFYQKIKANYHCYIAGSRMRPPHL